MRSTFPQIMVIFSHSTNSGFFMFRKIFISFVTLVLLFSFLCLLLEDFDTFSVAFLCFILFCVCFFIIFSCRIDMGEKDFICKKWNTFLLEVFQSYYSNLWAQFPLKVLNILKIIIFVPWFTKPIEPLKLT